MSTFWNGLIKSSIGETKQCSRCKKVQDCMQFLSLDQKHCIPGGYATCIQCRTKQQTARNTHS